MRQAFSSGNNFYPAPNASNLLTDLTNLQQVYEGDWLDEQEDAVEGIRNQAASILSQGAYAAMLRPWLKQFMKSVIGRTDLQSDLEMWQEFYLYCQAQALYAQSRAFTYGTAVANGSNTGNGQILRLTRDKYNFPIEGGYVESKRIRCVADENSGTRRGQEVFQMKGQARTRDEIDRSGSGLEGTLVGQTIDDSILNNAGFRSYGGTAAAPTSLTSWTSSAGDSSAVYTIDTTDYFRYAPSEIPSGTPSSLSLVASTRLQQYLTGAKQTSLSDNIPYLMAVIWNAEVGTAVGTLNIRMGGITTTVTVSGQSGWNVSLAPSNIALGFSCWYRQFAQANLLYEVEWIRTSGTIKVGEVLVLPGTPFDGCWYWAIPSGTPYAQWRDRDEYDVVDRATGSAKWQNAIMRGFPGVYVPSSDGSSVGLTEPS